MFQDFVGHVESALAREWLHLEGVWEWGNAWGETGLLGLHSHDKQKLNELRTLITTKCMQGKEFNTFPKEALVRSPDYTVILKSNMRTLHLDSLVERIIRHNRGVLEGTLIPSQTTVSYTHLTLRRYSLCRSRWSPYH